MKNNFVAKFMSRFNRASVEQDSRQELLDKIELLEAGEECDNFYYPSQRMKEAQARALERLKEMDTEQLSEMVDRILSKDQQGEKK